MRHYATNALVIVLTGFLLVAMVTASPAPNFSKHGKHGKGKVGSEKNSPPKNELVKEGGKIGHSVRVKIASKKKKNQISPTARVIRGEPVTSKTDWQFVVDLHKSPNFVSKSRFCTGTLIRKDIVLTAAHCVLNDGEMGEGTFATMGRINLLDDHKDNHNSESMRAVAAIAHPAYTGLGSRADVALLLLEGESTKRPIKLADRTPISGTKTTIVGYGLKAVGTLEATHRMIEVLPDRMQKTKLKIENRSFCDTPGSPRTAPGMLCTSGLHRGSSACRGDSGGGLFLASQNTATPKTQVGIVSYGDAMCMSEDSGVFTDVAANRHWIDETAERLSALHHGAEPVEVPAVGREVSIIRGAAAAYADGRSLKLFRVAKGKSEGRVEVTACVRRSLSTARNSPPRLYLARGVGRNVEEATFVGGRGGCRSGEIGLRLAYDVTAEARKGTKPAAGHDLVGLTHTGKKGGKLEFEVTVRSSQKRR